MEIYGESGYIFAENRNDMKMRGKDMSAEKQEKITSNDVAVYEDPFTYFADVIHKKITVPEYGLYSLKNNVEVVRILDAARESAKTGKTVFLKD
jgi:predicted dehydrogenase